MITVLGASGYIGGYLFRRLREDGVKAAGTYCRRPQANLLFFDLNVSQPDELPRSADGADYLIIAAAEEARIDQTLLNWERAYLANVVRTKALIDYCFTEGITPVYFSTDNVFNGEKGGYREGDARNPINGYGRIRNEIEDYLLSSARGFLLLRLGRVLGAGAGDDTLISGMARQMRDKRVMLCADDQRFTPVYIEDLYSFIKHAVTNGLRGVFHLASFDPLTHYTIALGLRRQLGFSGAEVIACKINSLGLLEKRPLLIDLDDTKAREAAGFRHRRLEDFLALFS
jgi:dTDP-4-dehydrorhamnose reductase